MTDRMTSRRTLLKAGGGSLLVAGLGLGAPAVRAAENGFAWSRAAVEALVGRQFWLNHPEHRALQITVEAVETSRIAPEGAEARQFSVVFSAAALPAIKAGSYEIENEATGRQLVFMQPAARQGARMTLRADFNLHA